MLVLFVDIFGLYNVYAKASIFTGLSITQPSVQKRRDKTQVLVDVNYLCHLADCMQNLREKTL